MYRLRYDYDYIVRENLRLRYDYDYFLNKISDYDYDYDYSLSVIDYNRLRLPESIAITITRSLERSPSVQQSLLK